MNNDILLGMLALLGVVMGAFLSFFSQYLLYRHQEKSDIRKKALEIKNSQCLGFWEAFSDMYQYLFFSGLYSENKIDLVELDKHIKRLNAAIIKAEPFISHQGYLQLIEVRDTLNKLLTVRDLGASLSGEEYVAFIMELEKPMNTARDVLRDELKLDELGILPNDKK